jgi:hypothetical protein
MGINATKEKPSIGSYIFAALFVIGLIAGTVELMNMLDRAAHHMEARK